MKNRFSFIKKSFAVVLFVALSFSFSATAFAQIIGGNTSTPSRYVFGTVYQGNGSTPLPFASVEFRGDASFSQKANKNGGFAFIVKPGRYSVWASATGYQSNVCFFTVDKGPVEVTFALGKLGVSSSSCDTSEASSSEVPIEARSAAQDTVGDGTGGSDPDGNSTTGTTTTSTGNTGATTTTSGGQVITKSDCVVTIIGKPATSPVLPPECRLASDTNGTTPGGGGQPGKPLPSENIEEIKKVLCSQYRVCPTETDAWRSSNGWTLMQLTALWNIIQKIYETPTYRNFAIGNNVLELTRAGHYEGGPGWVWGFHANGTFPEYHEIPGSRLIIITDTTNEAGSQKTLEWFFAHEIAHSASHGAKNGSWPNDLGASEAYQGVLRCGEVVSKYGNGSTDENYADTVAYYMTTGEDVTSYWGNASGGKGAGNLKIDHPCSYNALKTNYFDGKEF